MASIRPGATFAPKFTKFNILQAPYKVVDGHEIRADLIIPKSLPAGRKAPVIARFHGGGMVRGDSIYADWFPQWLLDMAETYGAVIISANYRFLPEVTGIDILDDVDDFWDWIHSESLASLLKQQQQEEATTFELDLDRIITAGDSAGGLLSVYLTLSQPDKIRAGTAAYPSLSWDNPPLLPAKKTENAAPESLIDEYIAKINPGQVESSDLALQRVRLSMTITAHQRGCGLFFRGASELPPERHPERLYQLARLNTPHAKLPCGGLVILHGTEDEAVLPEASGRFVHKARETLQGRQGADKVILALRPGGHGFDVSTPLHEEWLAEALRTAVDTWLE
ncbi:hypothetical protein UA08_03814 [Talaromyces atroroseus]|uniref:Alpha/beta hydrolase fold-3 domain-containing protein n=1 Tax=Talaromyces atroroseus TaxID=1441469 RepID=A0A225ASP3_TALAT|nr:hypothetical protein UA08_03814 [Talaromyces atroroseus]OKL61364.1 hypothetical protein UA08_03814 [Talaromyces atroroseus]